MHQIYFYLIPAFVGILAVYGVLRTSVKAAPPPARSKAVWADADEDEFERPKKQQQHYQQQQRQQQLPEQAFPEDQLKNLQKGFLSIDAPREMRAGDENDLTVRVGTQEARSAMDSIARAAGATVEEIQVHTYMCVEVDGHAFQIAEPKRVNLMIGGSRPTEWVFRIKALKSGDQELRVHVYARLTRPGAEQEYRTLEVATRTITVKVSWAYSVVTFWNSTDNVWRITLVILAPVLAGAIAYAFGLDSVKHAVDGIARHIFGISPAPPHK